MAVGPFVRGLFGKHERRLAELYRALFFDVDDYVGTLKRWQPDAGEILEVGCGEGVVTERLAAAYPGARITAIDITPRVGRLYGGRSEGVQFLQTDVGTIAREHPAAFDLVVLSDVLHHVPSELRSGLLREIRTAMRPDGLFVVKEWEKRSSLVYWLGYASDRWLTGDRIRYMTADELRCQLRDGLGVHRVLQEARISPWRTNIAMLVQ